MEWIVLMPLLFIKFLLLKNINNQLKVLFNLVILGLCLYATTHYFVNIDGYDIISAIFFNHFTPIYLLLGPCFYFFVLIRLELIHKIRPDHLIHFIPAIIHLISISQYFFIPWDEKIKIVQSIYNNPTIQENLNVNLFFTAKFNYAFRMIHFIFYCIVSLSKINKSLKTKSSSEKKLLLSLQKITIIFLILTLCYSIHIVLILISKSYTANIVKIILLLDVGLLAILVYELFKYPELFFNIQRFKQSYLETSPFINRRKNNNIVPDVIYNDIDQKINAIKIERSFLINPATNFEVFADKINQRKFHIRSYLKVNNSSFVTLKNEARVKEAIKYLESEKIYKLDYIAKMSGFNTRSNFFKIFKSVKKCTPLQYKESKRKLN